MDSATEDRADRLAALAATGRGGTVDAVVTHLVDGFRSGVARFNDLLAHQLGVPLERLSDAWPRQRRRPLLSFKLSDLPDDEVDVLARNLDEAHGRYELFLHELGDHELERRAISQAAWVHCGNHAILERALPLNPACSVAWTPGLILDDRLFTPAEVSVFSFGMAHKIRTEMFARLRGLLEASGKTFTVYVSAANHETASLSDAQTVFDEMHAVFPRGLYFLGNLSDVAVFNWLQQSTFFAAFFMDGVRANNTSVASAMERGAVVVTNLDRHSPPEFEHMKNVIDIRQCEKLPSDSLVLKRLSVCAMETARERGWDRLIAHLQDPV